MVVCLIIQAKNIKKKLIYLSLAAAGVLLASFGIKKLLSERGQKFENNIAKKDVLKVKPEEKQSDDFESKCNIDKEAQEKLLKEVKAKEDAQINQEIEKYLIDSYLFLKENYEIIENMDDKYFKFNKKEDVLYSLCSNLVIYLTFKDIDQASDEIAKERDMNYNPDLFNILIRMHAYQEYIDSIKCPSIFFFESQLFKDLNMKKEYINSLKEKMENFNFFHFQYIDNYLYQDEKYLKNKNYKNLTSHEKNLLKIIDKRFFKMFIENYKILLKSYILAKNNHELVYFYRNLWVENCYPFRSRQHTEMLLYLEENSLEEVADGIKQNNFVSTVIYNLCSLIDRKIRNKEIEKPINRELFFKEKIIALLEDVFLKIVNEMVMSQITEFRTDLYSKFRISTKDFINFNFYSSSEDLDMSFNFSKETIKILAIKIVDSANDKSFLRYQDDQEAEVVENTQEYIDMLSEKKIESGDYSKIQEIIRANFNEKKERLKKDGHIFSWSSSLFDELKKQFPDYVPGRLQEKGMDLWREMKKNGEFNLV